MPQLNAWKKYNKKDLKSLNKIADRYRAFLNESKTERECASYIVKKAEKNGYISLQSAIASQKTLEPGDRIYVNQMGKAVMMFIIGHQPLENGLKIVGSHIDSPRLDLKQNPLYEEGGFAYADTHYYGGIKYYQWVARQIALHGVVVKKDGTVTDIQIGEDENDPVVGVSDLLIHLSKEQMSKNASEAIPGEKLDLILAGRPLKGKNEKPVKELILQLMKEKYDIDEDDLISAEIEAVPAEKARDFGLDRSMIIGYGHDDRCCAYASLEAILNIEGIPENTVCCMMVDKEEIGSVGATGMRARYFENAVAELISMTAGEYSELRLRRCLENSSMLSCDVSAGYDPMFDSVFEKKNSAYLGNGVCYNKYTGSRGKSGSNDANAEFMAKIRTIMDENDITWQTAELGKVDAGGGGTIAYICALYGMNVIDSGIAVLNMHAPMEIISKADLYEAEKAYLAFMQN